MYTVRQTNKPEIQITVSVQYDADFLGIIRASTVFRFTSIAQSCESAKAIQ